MLRAMQLRRPASASLSFQALVVAGVTLAATASGCAYGSVRQVLRAQFASDVDCSAITIKRRNFWYVSDNPHQYKISGCGVMRTYTCTQEDADGLISYDEPACKWEEGDADAPKPKARPAQPADDDMYDEPEPYQPDDSMDEPGSDSDADLDADLDAEADAPKGSVKAKAKGGLSFGSD